jgi:hypothetical protein
MKPEQREKWMASRVTHGAYLGGREKPEHAVWRTMISRCQNPKRSEFQYYGGRGISVCERWTLYENFIMDMGERPSPAHSLDRINNDGDYEPSNCRWATRSEQQKNKGTTRMYTNGRFTGTLSECAKYLGISKELAHWRWKTHNTFEKGLQWQELQKAQ